MRLLLDTDAALWWAAGDARRFGREARRRVNESANEVLLSAVVVWEIAVKRSLGKLEVRGDLVGALLEGGAEPLPVTLEHAAAVEHLPWNHRDPFDRLLVAQAVVESATLVSNDDAVRAYGVPTVW